MVADLAVSFSWNPLLGRCSLCHFGCTSLSSVKTIACVNGLDMAWLGLKGTVSNHFQVIYSLALVKGNVTLLSSAFDGWILPCLQTPPLMFLTAGSNSKIEAVCSAMPTSTKDMACVQPFPECTRFFKLL
jgi:hypothetical protein